MNNLNDFQLNVLERLLHKIDMHKKPTRHPRFSEFGVITCTLYFNSLDIELLAMINKKIIENLNRRE